MPRLHFFYSIVYAPYAFGSSFIITVFDAYVKKKQTDENDLSFETAEAGTGRTLSAMGCSGVCRKPFSGVYERNRQDGLGKIMTLTIRLLVIGNFFKRFKRT